MAETTVSPFSNHTRLVAVEGSFRNRAHNGVHKELLHQYPAQGNQAANGRGLHR